MLNKQSIGFNARDQKHCRERIWLMHKDNKLRDSYQYKPKMFCRQPVKDISQTVWEESKSKNKFDQTTNKCRAEIRRKSVSRTCYFHWVTVKDPFNARSPQELKWGGRVDGGSFSHPPNGHVRQSIAYKSFIQMTLATLSAPNVPLYQLPEEQRHYRSIRNWYSSCKSSRMNEPSDLVLGFFTISPPLHSFSISAVQFYVVLNHSFRKYKLSIATEVELICPRL